MSGPDVLAGFHHRFDRGAPGAETLLLLHGTGGDEHDLVGVGRALSAEANLLSPRGQVLERGMPRFFRRLAEGVFDLPDLEARTHGLAAFVEAAVERYSLDASRITAVGFSNGANIAASLLLTHPRALRAAVLFRPMVPFEPRDLPALAGTSVFVSAGRADTITPPDQAERLAALLREAGADVTLSMDDAGHVLLPPQVAAAREWLATRSAASR